jgi:hypothetical protein
MNLVMRLSGPKEDEITKGLMVFRNFVSRAMSLGKRMRSQ